MSKELRKALREKSSGAQRIRIELEACYTEATKDILKKYPYQDGEWRHPLEHYYDRVLFFLQEAEKTLNRIVQCLPAERKTKVVKFIEPKQNKKEKSLDEQAKATKAPRSRKADSGAKKRGRKPKVQTGNSGNDNKFSGDGIQPKVQRTRKRGRPPKQK